MAELAAAKLKPGGLCLAYVGQLFLPQIMQQMGDHLDWWWLFAIRLGSNARQYNRMTLTCMRPVVAYFKPPLKLPHDWMMDLHCGDNQDKRFHEWGQGERAPAYWIERLTQPGDLIVDPYCGGGMTPAACKRTGRRWLATEIDPETADIARMRIAGLNAEVASVEVG